MIDNVRRDHLGLYGYERPTSPNLEKLAQESCVYMNAHSASPWTSPAHASMFTGLYPVAHGTTQESTALKDAVKPLPVLLKGMGYKTIGISENPVVSPYNRFDRGFDAFHRAWESKEDPQEGNLSAGILDEVMKELDTEQPFFLFVNLMAAHIPYFTSGRHFGRFSGDSKRRFRFCGITWQDHYLGREHHTPDDFDHMRDYYDEAICQVDEVAGNIVSAFKRAGLWDNTAVVVASDHGENFGEHNHMNHVFCLYETLTRVPMLVRVPGDVEPGTSNDAAVQLVDVFPTLLAAADGGSPAPFHQGRNLLETNTGARDIFCEYYRPKQAFQCFKPEDKDAPALTKYDRRIRSLSRGTMKVVWASDGVHEMYDLERDPEERNNLYVPENPGEAASLLQELEALTNRYKAESPIAAADGAQPSEQKLDEDTAEAMRDIGYLH